MSALRKRYERQLGELSDRQWRRICRWLELDQDDMSQVHLLDAYMLLRVAHPRSLIRRQQVINYLSFVECFPVATCKGDDLLEGLRRVLTPCPSMETVYRWGREIGCPFSRDRWYSPREVKLWMQKVLGQQRFRIVRRFPGIEKLGA